MPEWDAVAASPILRGVNFYAPSIGLPQGDAIRRQGLLVSGANRGAYHRRATLGEPSRPARLSSERRPEKRSALRSRHLGDRTACGAAWGSVTVA